MISRFIGEYKEFSNFEPAQVRFENITFPTVEHAYVAAKSRDPKFRRDIALMPANKAGLAKKWGRTTNLRSDWEKVKIEIMKELLLQKFAPKKPASKISIVTLSLHDLLLSTGDELLVEGNFWHDNFWGNCLCDKCMKIEGKNHLGLLLMKVREYYQLEEEGFKNLEMTS